MILYKQWWSKSWPHTNESEENHVLICLIPRLVLVRGEAAQNLLESWQWHLGKDQNSPSALCQQTRKSGIPGHITGHAAGNALASQRMDAQPNTSHILMISIFCQRRTGIPMRLWVREMEKKGCRWRAEQYTSPESLLAEMPKEAVEQVWIASPRRVVTRWDRNSGEMDFPAWLLASAGKPWNQHPKRSSKKSRDSQNADPQRGHHLKDKESAPKEGKKSTWQPDECIRASVVISGARWAVIRSAEARGCHVNWDHVSWTKALFLAAEDLGIRLLPVVWSLRTNYDLLFVARLSPSGQYPQLALMERKQEIYTYACSQKTKNETQWMMKSSRQKFCKRALVWAVNRWYHLGMIEDSDTASEYQTKKSMKRRRTKHETHKCIQLPCLHAYA